MNIRWLFPLLVCSLAGGETQRFLRQPEPKEGAFTILLPAGWKASGGIVRVNPLAANGALNAIGAKLDFTVSSPDGKVTLRWLPETNYVDTRGTALQGMFAPGSNYNGAPVAPKMSAQLYLLQAVFPLSHRGASQVTVAGRYPLPGVAAGYQRVVREMRLPVQFAYDAALVVISYNENGGAWREALYTAIQDWGPAGNGLWTNKDTFTVRAPASEFDKAARMVSVIVNSVELNPRWVEGEIRGQIQRNEIAIRAQQDIARLDREIVEHRRRTNAEINNQMYHSLMGTEEYVNPLTKKTETGSNAWNYRWVNDRGEAIYSDDASFDPVRAGLSGYVKSPVRKRFPE
jgi:hypothetical protein